MGPPGSFPWAAVAWQAAYFRRVRRRRPLPARGLSPPRAAGRRHRAGPPPKPPGPLREAGGRSHPPTGAPDGSPPSRGSAVPRPAVGSDASLRSAFARRYRRNGVCAGVARPTEMFYFGRLWRTRVRSFLRGERPAGRRSSPRPPFVAFYAPRGPRQAFLTPPVNAAAAALGRRRRKNRSAVAPAPPRVGAVRGPKALPEPPAAAPAPAPPAGAGAEGAGAPAIKKRAGSLPGEAPGVPRQRTIARAPPDSNRLLKFTILAFYQVN